MPTIKRFGLLQLRMYPGDHLPPHFHVVGPETEAIVSLESLELWAGRAKKSDLREVLAWAEANRDSLWQTWQLLNKSR